MGPPPRKPPPRFPPPSDPLITRPGHPSVNPVFAPGVNTFERGTILEVDARRHSYRVAVSSGRVISMGRIRSSPGDTALLERGTNVVVSMALGEPYIFGILPLGVAHTDDGPTLSGLDGHGGTDPALDRHLTASARDPGAPSDMLPGDAGLRGPDGASVAAMKGKVAQMMGGPLARIQAFGDGDKVAIRTGEFELNSWVAEVKHTNEGGATNYSWRSGVDQLTQTGADEGRYTVHLDVGSVGDVIKLEVTNRDRQALFRFHVDSHGRVELFAAGGFAHMGGDGPGAIHETAHHGDAAHEITGDSSQIVGGSRKDMTGGSWISQAGGLIELLAGTDLSLTGTSSATLQSGGETLVSGTDKTTIAGRGVIVNPRLAEFRVESALPDKIVLGTGATSHATKYEELVILLTTILGKLNALSAAVAAHVHPPAPPTPPGSPVPMSPALAGFAAPLVVNFPLARAQTVIIR